MKKTLLSAALAIAVFVGCNKDENIIEETVTLTCGFAGEQPETRVAFDNADLAGTAAKLQPKWESGDAIAVVLDDASLVKFTLTGGAGTKFATFEGTVPEGRTIARALYPWRDGAQNQSEWISDFSSKNFTQTYDADRIFDIDANTYYGTVSGESISFSQLSNEFGSTFNLGYILLRLKGTAKITDISCSFVADIKLTCDTPVQLSSEDETLFGIVYPMYYIDRSGGSLTFRFYADGDDADPLLTKSVNVGTGIAPHTLLDLPALTVNAPATGTTDGHGWVKIGGVTWATMNVGATTVAGSPSTCYGDYYAWGETEPRYTGITINGANSVTFEGWKSNHSSGYSSDDFPTYTGSTLDAEHDAATQNWGAGWRTPTTAEFKALAKACTGTDSYQTVPSSLTTSNPEGGIYWLASGQDYLPEYKGVAGVLFVDRSDTSLRVFLPAAGYCSSTTYYKGGTDGDYWSSSIFSSNASYACPMWTNSSSVRPSFFNERKFGFTVRPVKD